MTFEQITELYKHYSLKQFDTSAGDSIEGLIREALELQLELNEPHTTRQTLLEFADVQFYLLYALFREQYTLEDLIAAMDIKLEILKTRKWKQNPDNTYSHV